MINFNDKKLLEKSIKFSLIVQVIAGILSIFGIFIEVSKKDRVLNHILIIDTVVQFIELLFYIYLASFLSKLDNNVIASQRYFDWVITTPIMLYATILLMEYVNPKNKDKIVTIENVNRENGSSIITILLLNLGMLIFGYLGEINLLNKWFSIGIGFLFFGLSFKDIWFKFGRTSEIAKNLYYFLFVVWGLYGVAAFFSVIPKNTMYNILDIISKNFYGLLVFYLIITKSNLKNK